MLDCRYVFWGVGGGGGLTETDRQLMYIVLDDRKMGRDGGWGWQRQIDR